VTWFGQGIFALPCGSSGGASTYGKTLEADVVALEVTFAPLGDLALDVMAGNGQALTIWLTGSVSVDPGGANVEFRVLIDGSAAGDVVALNVADSGAFAVSLTAHEDVATGPHTIVAEWRAGGGTASGFVGHLHLEVLVAARGVSPP